MEESKIVEPKSLDLFNTTTFMANGKKYFVTKKISIARWREFEKLQPRLTYGVGFAELYANVAKAYEALNTKQGNVADAAVILHNIMSGIKDVENPNREHPSMLMAALVINREDENPAIYDEQFQNEKINDWKVEGYDNLPFFIFALNSMQGFREAYVEYMAKEMTKNQSTSKETVQNLFRGTTSK